jgi:ribonuclease P protein component
MLPFKNRLKRRKEIERVFREGETFKEDPLILKKKKNNLRESRFCFIVSEKVSKKATARNKLKRRMRESIRLNLEKIKKGFDVVLIALPGSERKDFSEIKKKLDKLLLKAEILI